MRADYTFRRDGAGIDALLHTRDGATGQWMARLVNTGVTFTKEAAPVRTGLLRSRIEGEVVIEGGQVVGIIAARTNYARWVNDGTRYAEGDHFLEVGVERAMQAYGLT